MSKKAKTTKHETSEARPYPSREEPNEPEACEKTDERGEGWGWLQATDVEPSDVAKWDLARYDQAVWP